MKQDLKQHNDSHKLRGLTLSFAPKHSPKVAPLTRGAPAPRQLDAGCAIRSLEMVLSSTKDERLGSLYLNN
jgi:hypothetical protein